MKNNILVVCLTLALIAGTASAGLVGFYDGSYDPTSVTPPLGQSTWTVLTTGDASITPNSPNAGIATIVDDQAGVSSFWMYRSTFGQWGEGPASTGWEFGGTFKLASNSFTPIVTTNPAAALQAAVGFRDEGGSGKSALLAWTAHKTDPEGPVYHSLRMIGLGSTGWQTAFAIDFNNYFDDQWHTYKVEKKEVPGLGMRIFVSIDDVLVTGEIGQNYADLFPDDITASLGFGLYTTGGGTVDMQVDSLYYIPEPATIALMSIGGLFLVRRKKKMVNK